MLLALIFIALAVLILYGLPLGVRWIQVKRWKKINGKLAITYDDGPDTVTTVAILDLLKELGVPGTFYIVGFRAVKYPEILERIRKDGHQLGTHSYWHKNAWKIPFWREYSDAMKVYNLLPSSIDGSCSYRPPFGKVSMLTLVGMWLRKRRVEWWTVAANDTVETLEGPVEKAKQILDDGQTVVLMHCFHKEDRKRRYVLELTRALIEQAKEREIAIVTMRDLEGV